MDGKMDEEDVVYTEHASILSHLPTIHDPTTDLHILIYAPGLTRPPPLNYTPRPETEMASNLGSSYSQIMTPAQTPGSELPPEDRQTHEEQEEDDEFPSPSRQFDALYQQALTLVAHPSQILCFTTPQGYIPLLRHLAPRVCYISDMLAREEDDKEGEGKSSAGAVEQLKGWVGQTVLVVGDEGTGGLADTEDTEDDDGQGREGRRGGQQGKCWWERSPEVGLGKPIEIVDAARVGEDWGRRVSGRM
ncbi:hypothetical protein BTJ68_06642 [Hortaea werneckii EXF-2000]|uniref:Uncharacterized protein n=1 Tax=Hortaea werneckii EXF-2000 TaxID=1157616 RepID=A0A1Z5TI98_HORWE|nr:hypothetical protein BTJ68_06642 [Hortaea werneckii EXF-2000]